MLFRVWTSLTYLCSQRSIIKVSYCSQTQGCRSGFFLNGGIRVNFLLENFLDSYIERKKLRMNCIRFKFDPNPCYFSKAFSGFVFFFMAGPGSGFFLKVGSGLFGSESAPAHTNHSCDVKPFFSVYTIDNLNLWYILIG